MDQDSERIVPVVQNNIINIPELLGKPDAGVYKVTTVRDNEEDFKEPTVCGSGNRTTRWEKVHLGRRG